MFCGTKCVVDFGVVCCVKIGNGSVEKMSSDERVRPVVFFLKAPSRDLGKMDEKVTRLTSQTVCIGTLAIDIQLTFRLSDLF